MQLNNRKTGEVLLDMPNKSLREALIHAGRNPIDLTDVDLSGVNLTGATLADLHMPGADLTKADLESAIIEGGDWTGAQINNARLVSATFYGTILDRVQFNSADLTYASFEELRMTQADFTDADMASINWYYVDLDSSILRKCVMFRNSFHAVDFKRCYIEELDWDGTGLLNISLQGTQFKTTNGEIITCDGHWYRVDNIDDCNQSLLMFHCPPYGWYIDYAGFDGPMEQFFQTIEGQYYKDIVESLARRPAHPAYIETHESSSMDGC